MFDDIGGKIKNLATFLCIIGIIASLVSAIGLWTQNSDYTPTIFAGILVLVFGSLGSWVGSFFTYGFGELIEQVTAVNANLSAIRSDTPKQGISVPSSTVQGEQFTASTARASLFSTSSVASTSVGETWLCKKCGTRNPKSSLSCKDCGEYR